jgi:hypothetical protein
MKTPPRKEVHLYVDDSGSRDPDRKRNQSDGEVDWFGLGGFLIHSEDKPAAEQLIENFRAQWPQLGDKPLRSYDIRSKTGAFRWLLEVGRSEQDRFYNGLSALVRELPIVVHACVVDRPGYNKRYMEQYGRRRWRLCRTAFTILMERAAKYARMHDARLRVFVERSDKPTESQFKAYFDEARREGLPFDAGRSQKYAPLTAADMHQTLFEFGVRTKASLLMQVADLVLWPVCIGGYFPDNRNFAELRDGRKLLDAHCTDENGLHGVKYSCFDAAASEMQKPTEVGS